MIEKNVQTLLYCLSSFAYLQVFLSFKLRLQLCCYISILDRVTSYTAHYLKHNIYSNLVQINILSICGSSALFTNSNWWLFWHLYNQRRWKSCGTTKKIGQHTHHWNSFTRCNASGSSTVKWSLTSTELVFYKLQGTQDAHDLFA